DELRRRLLRERLLGLGECNRSGVTPAPAATVDGRRLRGRDFDVVDAEALPLRELRLALLPDREQRRRDEDRRVRARGDADDERERKVLQRRAAEDEQRDDRQQRDERGRQGTPDRLPQRYVRDRGERLLAHQRDVLANAVEDDDRVVDRVAEHG